MKEATRLVTTQERGVEDVLNAPMHGLPGPDGGTEGVRTPDLVNADWTVLGPLTESPPGQYHFADRATTSVKRIQGSVVACVRWR